MTALTSYFPLILLLFVNGCTCNFEDSAIQVETCEKDEDGTCLHENTEGASKYKAGAHGPGKDNKYVNLTQRKANKIGEEIVLQEVHHERNLTMRALSIKPQIFEIDNFLSELESKHLIKLAVEKGLKDSITHQESSSEHIRIMDVDGNQQLSVSEMMLTLENSFDIYFDEEDVLKMYTTLKMDPNEDEIIERHELQDTSPDKLTNYLNKYIARNPVKRSRLSKQAWLFPSESKDEIFKLIQDRVQKLTQLPEVLIRKSDFQVVKYGPDGHYNAHIDSGQVTKTVPCCHRGYSPRIRCRICRFVTVLFYLNNVQEGGGTAFPVAGNQTYNESELRTSHKINLHRFCHDANLIVEPKIGKSVMWYNHKIDDSGWLGELDTMTWHGGCPVVKGEKWIANFWIKTTDDREFDLKPLP